MNNVKLRKGQFLAVDFKVHWREDAHSGWFEQSAEGILNANKLYKAIGMTWKRYDDGSSTLCYIVIVENGLTRLIAIDKLVVVEE